MECVELAPAFERRTSNDSASELDALHTLRAVESACKIRAAGEQVGLLHCRPLDL